MIKLFDIYVDITDTICVKGKLHDACMLSFTGEARGRYFNGKVIGTGFDTQYSSKDGHMVLSARYILEGAELKAEIETKENGVIVSIFG